MKRRWLAAPGLALKKVVAPLLHALALRVERSPEWVPGPLTYNQDGLATVHNSDFLRDPHFLEAYRLGYETGSWGEGGIHWRVYVVCWAAGWARRLEGDFVECGVNRGGYSRAVMHFVDFPSLAKTFYLLDTFHGLDSKYVSDAERRRGVMDYDYDECYEAVCKTFAGLPAVIIRGAVPETLPQVKARKICYLSIDMNCLAPEIAAAEYFWDKLVPGGVMILDDYGWTIHIDQKMAFDRFARERGAMVLPLPTGQGLILKPPPAPPS
jgi:O-methyltransferase